ncbi:hypothetical protein, variant [Aphanomyces invadans]|uniref:HI0933 family flavoprotein n=1 Tax=Aphanomyces invadans TaxID=157072 RepID=A0A024TBT1_9STRA|nr:hypothetical protein H310_13983 [Aphanomyces invadans]XP_008879892.1 hypothetical protein, variant [Aphanomyces invadans]ETV91439.1 hypothetical protein H310_13983 [Aphanomyces invadans]ETV91440.1 hypothetical protein, variant [Aphanomyces invadans]|eukprot:XP_008879891.1 hypothetical protein H310_13983 [Aphanomyces invadans]
MAARVADVVVVGGGPAGVFCAQAIKHLVHCNTRIVVLEATKELLKKVKISGGGRCNVTHARNKFSIRDLVQQYPRGNKSLMGQLTRFGIDETHAWFEDRGVKLHTEPDGRVFPATNSSATIVNALLHAAKDVEFETRTRVTGLTQTEDGRFEVTATHKASDDEHRWTATSVVIAGGSSVPLWSLVKSSFGIEIEPPVPSLFTFQIDNDPRLEGLAGISVDPARVTLPTAKKLAPVTGPVLITHNGLSGPAILRQSAFAAIPMHAANYKMPVQVDWTGGRWRLDEVVQLLKAQRQAAPQRNLRSVCPVLVDGKPAVPQRLWSRLALDSDIQWSNASNDVIQSIASNVVQSTFHTSGKATFKEEFVTAGGVQLNQLTKNLEAKAVPRLYFVGEFLNVDGVTGGFNFTGCWSSAVAVAHHIASGLRQP